MPLLKLGVQKFGTHYYTQNDKIIRENYQIQKNISFWSMSFQRITFQLLNVLEIVYQIPKFLKCIFLVRGSLKIGFRGPDNYLLLMLFQI